MFSRKYIVIFLLIGCLFSCDASVLVSITNGYPYTVKLNVLYDYQGEVLSRSSSIDEGITQLINARGFVQYDHIRQIQVLDLDGVIIAEYDPEYIMRIRNAYSDEQDEQWTVTEKGLFRGSREIRKRFRSDSKEKWLEYYGSDEAVKELERRLNAAN